MAVLCEPLLVPLFTPHSTACTHTHSHSTSTMTNLPPIPAPIFQSRPRNRHSSASTTADDTDTPLTTTETQEKITRFNQFIDTKLKPDLTTTLNTRDQLYTTAAQYIQLRTNLTHLTTTHTTHFTARVNVGCDFYCQAEVESTELVAVDVGLGFRVELTLAEAVVVCDERERYLLTRADVLTERASVISAHIKLVYEGIAELMRVQESATKRQQSGGRNFYG